MSIYIFIYKLNPALYIHTYMVQWYTNKHFYFSKLNLFSLGNCQYTIILSQKLCIRIQKCRDNIFITVEKAILDFGKLDFSTKNWKEKEKKNSFKSSARF